MVRFKVKPKRGKSYSSFHKPELLFGTEKNEIDGKKRRQC
jgi:hypothetical protein